MGQKKVHTEVSKDWVVQLLPVILGSVDEVKIVEGRLMWC